MNTGHATSASTTLFIFAAERPVIESGLGQKAGYEIIGWESDLDKVGQRIGAMRPDVVILACEGPVGDAPLAVTRLCAEHPGIRILTINLEAGANQNYGGEPALLRDMIDLVTMIQLRAARAPGRAVADPGKPEGEKDRTSTIQAANSVYGKLDRSTRGEDND